MSGCSPTPEPTNGPSAAGMLIHINSYPGVGKLTIALELQRLIGGKVLDNHSVYNVALALCELKSPEYYETLRAVRRIAYDRIAAIPANIPVVLTNAHAEQSKWGQEARQSLHDLADARGTPLLSVILTCDPDEHARRIQSVDRRLARKPTDPDLFQGNRDGVPLLDCHNPSAFTLDVTALTAGEAAQAISSWLSASQ